jgi:hypothetical protein
MTELRAAAERAITEQVHPANWAHWVRLVLMAGPARDFIEAASPSAIIALLDAGPPAPPAPLDVKRVIRAIHSVAKRHRIVKDEPPPLSLMRIFGYSAAPDEMDAEIAHAYATEAKSAHEPGEPHRYQIECPCGQRGTIRLSVDPETAP